VEQKFVKFAQGFFPSQNRKTIERREEKNEADVDYLIVGFLNTSSLLFEKVFFAHYMKQTFVKFARNFFFSKLQKIKRHEEENRRRP
jgi:hypothetical protein